MCCIAALCVHSPLWKMMTFQKRFPSSLFVAIYAGPSCNPVSEVSFSLFMIYFPFESTALGAFGST